MDLNYGQEYENFRKEVQKFCKEYSGVTITNKKGGALTSLNAVADSDKSDGPVSYTHLTLPTIYSV